MPNPKIFVSRGTPHSDKQREFCDRLYSLLRSKGFDVVTIGEHRHGVRQAHELARDEIAQCDGAVVIAFKRLLIVEGRDKPGSSSEQKVEGRYLPTTWNHLEAAYAYARKLPFLMLIEKGVYREAMLSKRFEWEAMECEIDPSIFGTEEFLQRLDHWCEFVSKKPGNSLVDLDLEKLTIGHFWSALTVRQASTVLASAFGILAAVAIAAYNIGAALGN